VTIHELLAKFSADDITFQRLDEALISVNENRKGTKVTFGTPLSAFDVVEKKLGLVLWVDSEKWNAAVAEHKGAKETAHCE